MVNQAGDIRIVWFLLEDDFVIGNNLCDRLCLLCDRLCLLSLFLARGDLRRNATLGIGPGRGPWWLDPLTAPACFSGKRCGACGGIDKRSRCIGRPTGRTNDYVAREVVEAHFARWARPFGAAHRPAG